MRAITQDRYGLPDALEMSEVDKPTPKDDEVLVRVRAASVHPGDYFGMTGVPYIMRLGFGLRRPRKATPGYDVSGLVEAVGKNVTEFQLGDEVFGEGSGGSCAEYVATPAAKLVLKPENLTLEQAATVAVSGVTALRGLRDAGKVQPGDKVLINGASGGVGTYAVQIAKSMGAEVTGVCSSKNVEMLLSIGADHVIDYTKEDFTDNGPQYDLILDNVANRSSAELRRALVPTGKMLPNSGLSEGRWFGAMGRMAKAALLSIFVSKQGRPYVALVKKGDLAELQSLIEAGKVKPVIDQTFSLEETPQAMALIGGGHSRGKIVVTI